MKRFKSIIVIAIVMFVGISPLFKALFFDFEKSLFLSGIALLSLLYFFYKLIAKEEIHFNKWLFIFGAALIAAYCLAFLNATNMRQNIQMILQNSEYLIVAAILYDYFRDKKDRLALFIMVPAIITGFVCSIIGLVAITGLFPSLEAMSTYGHVNSVFEYKDTASIYFVVCAILVLALVGYFKSGSIAHRVARMLLAGSGGIIILAFFLAASRGGFLIGVLCALLFITFIPVHSKLPAFVHLLIITLPSAFISHNYFISASSKDLSRSILWLLAYFASSAVLILIYELVLYILPRGKKAEDETHTESEGMVFQKAYKKNLAVSMAFLFICAISGIVFFILFRDWIIAFLPQNIGKFIESINFKDINLVYRLEFKKLALELIKDNWLTGLGGGGWNSLYQSEQGFYFIAKFAHDAYLQIFLEAGIIGFLAYLSIIVFTAVKYFSALLKSLETKSILLISALFCSFLALALHSSFDFDLEYMSLDFMLWAFIAAAAVYGGWTVKEKPAVDDGAKIKEKIHPGNIGAVKLFLVLICCVLFPLNAMYGTATFYGVRGYELMYEGKLPESASYYLRAVSLDGLNAEYYFELAKIYYYFADTAGDKSSALEWRQNSLDMILKSTELDKYYPNYIAVTAQTYFTLGQLDKALDYAKQLVKNQPRYAPNYEMLARDYVKYSLKLISDKNYSEARSLLADCSEMVSIPETAKSTKVKLYMGQALLLLGKYDDAEKLLLASSKSSDTKSDSRILLYKLYEMTGKKTADFSETEIKSIKSSELYNLNFYNLSNNSLQ